MALRHDYQTNTTWGYLGFHSSTDPKAPSPGDRLLKALKLLKTMAQESMLLPALAAGIWSEYLHNENHRSANKLRAIQGELGVVDLYLQPKQEQEQEQERNPQPIRSDEVHDKIVSQHAFLTNGVSEFLSDLFVSMASATNDGEAIQTPTTVQQPSQQQSQRQQGSHSSAIAMTEELSEYVSHMRMRARAEIQHHDRILSRVSMYLQVVSETSQTTCCPPNLPARVQLTKTTTALQPHATRSRARYKTRLLRHEEYFAPDHGIPAGNGYCCKISFATESSVPRTY